MISIIVKMVFTIVNMVFNDRDYDIYNSENGIHDSKYGTIFHAYL